MDPNVSLTILRDYLSAWRDNIPIGSRGLEDLMVTLEGLDEWLSKGGFPPDAWNAMGWLVEAVMD